MYSKLWILASYQFCVYATMYNANWIGVMISCECRVVDSRQLHLWSTRVLNGSASWKVIWGFMFLYQLDNDDLTAINCEFY